MKNTLHKHQNGSVIGLALVIILIVIGYIVFTNVFSSDSSENAGDSRVIEQAQDSVDKASDALGY